MGQRTQRAGSDFGRLLRYYRQHCTSKFTQADLAAKVFVSPSLISAYESGTRLPRRRTAMRIACELGLNREDTRKLLLSLEFPSGGLPAADALLEELDQLFSSPRVSSELKAQLAVVVSSALQTWKEVQTKKVRWAVIPVAGWHARLLSPRATAQLVCRAIAEARACAIDRIVIVVAPSQAELLAQALTAYHELSNGVKERKIRFAVQKDHIGLGYAIVAAEGFLPDNEPFALILPDDAVEKSCLTSMMAGYDQYQCCIVAVRKLEAGDQESYGVASMGGRKTDSIYAIQALEERPGGTLREPSLTVMGRYILAPEILKVLKITEPDPKSGQIELTTALHLLAQGGLVLGYIYKGEAYNISPPRRLLAKQLQEFLSVSLI
jgi:UTP-glucose-1-phosphate uridylyltransferase/transcriptional regulator with XRE-family HTH domain